MIGLLNFNCIIAYNLSSHSHSHSASASQSPSPSLSSFPSRRGLFLVCYVFPQSESQPNRITNKLHPPPTSDLPNKNYSDNIFGKLRKPNRKVKQRDKERSGHLKADATSDQEALQLFDQMLAAKNPQTSIIQFNQHLTAYVKTLKNSSSTVFFIFTRLIQAEGISPDKYTYAILMEFCARTNQASLVFGFLGRFLKEGHRPNAAHFSPILKALIWENRIDEATTMILDKMPKVGCEPNAFPYNILLDRLCKKGEVEKAMDFLDAMISKGQQPDVVTYSSLIDGLRKNHEMDKAMDLLNVMISKGLEPNVVTYSTLIDGLCKKNEIDKAMDLLNVMISNGLEPDVVTYNTLIDGFCKQGEIKKAMDFLHVMSSKGLEPDVVTYSSLIDGLCKNGETETALRLVDVMICKGRDPNVVTYNIILDGLLKKGEIEKAMNFIDIMISKGKTPDVVTYNLILGMHVNGEVEKVLKLGNYLVSKGLVPDVPL